MKPIVNFELSAQIAGSVSEDFAKDLNVYLDEKEGTDIRALPFAIELMADAGELLNAAPIVGSGLVGEKKNKQVDTACNNPDYYIKERTNDDGKLITSVGSFWHDTADKTSVGQAIAAGIVAIDAAIGDKENADAKLKGLPDNERKAIRKRLTTRQNKLHAAFRRAAEIVQQVQAFGEADKFGCAFMTTPIKPAHHSFKVPADLLPDALAKGGEYLAIVPEPIMIFELTEENGRVREGKRSNKSITTFLGYDVKVALKNGGTLTNLLATAKRGTKTTTPTEATKHPLIKTFGAWESSLYSMGGYLDEMQSAEAQKKFDAQLLARMGQKDGDAFVEAFGDVAMAMDRAWTTVSERYNAIKARKATVVKAA